MNIKKHYDLIATGFGIGKIRTRVSPETIVTLAALLIWMLISYLFTLVNLPFFARNIIFFFLTLFTLVLGAISSDSYSYKANEEDPKEVVIDEFCGQLFVLWIVSIIVGQTFIVGFFTFLIFNLFIKIKPSIIIEFAQKFKGGIRIMIDDLLFAIATMITGYIFYKISYFVLRLLQNH